MKRKHYSVVIIPAAISIIILSMLSFYILGVVNKSDALEVIDDRISVVCSKLDSTLESSEIITEEIYNDYCSKARAVSIILSKNADALGEEVMLEEMRVAIGAESICISDSNGVIVFSTQMSSEENYVLEEFMPATKNKTFSKAVLSESNYNLIYTGASRLDKSGVIQIKYSLQNYQQPVGIADIVSQTPILKHGHLAVADAQSGKFISHTDTEMNGKEMSFPKEEFEEDSGYFSTEYEGSNVLLSYTKHNDMIVLGFLPYSEIYTQRNTAVCCAAFSMLILSVVIILAMRNYVLRKMVKLKNK